VSCYIIPTKIVVFLCQAARKQGEANFLYSIILQFTETKIKVSKRFGGLQCTEQCLTGSITLKKVITEIQLPQVLIVSLAEGCGQDRYNKIAAGWRWTSACESEIFDLRASLEDSCKRCASMQCVQEKEERVVE